MLIVRNRSMTWLCLLTIQHIWLDEFQNVKIAMPCLSTNCHKINVAIYIPVSLKYQYATCINMTTSKPAHWVNRARSFKMLSKGDV